MKKMRLKDLHAALAPMSPTVRKRVARTAKTSSAMLSQYANGHRTMSAAKAALVEKATGVPRESLCAACGACDLARMARTAFARGL
ncbi:hypothetical protein UFOVP1326_24 [uncultured Caudovirales phage]|uniref:Uncharacterized protein n=1 Tax=uncultured Caudovirales phage TaxID=2100421 RepID=A0A6J5S2D2_9CAUD|nr:hypothetical protein UFOVP1326_24 [uncultured Caudovirales phage]CAB4212497.1 hypothetical protein UFOVP1436_15 [uncultured Caudovirales phage]